MSTIIDGICEALYEEFGDEYRIYTELVEQGLQEPCFFVQRISDSRNMALGVRYRNDSQYCIHYFPSTRNANDECSYVKDRLYDCLEQISVEEHLINCLDMRSEMNENVLMVMVPYTVFTATASQVDIDMDSIDFETRMKG